MMLLELLRLRKSNRVRILTNDTAKNKIPSGKDEYVLLPIAVYRTLKDQIKKELAAYEADQDAEQAYEPFVLEDYVDDPVTLARIKAGITQEQLAQHLGVSQAYVSQIERRTNIPNKILERVQKAFDEAK